MDSPLILGIGISVVSSFARWRFPAVPKPLAAAGLAVGIGLIALSQIPQVRPLYAGLAILGLALLAAIADWALSPERPKASIPAISGVHDQRVTSHGQTGGITARNVTVHDGE